MTTGSPPTDDGALTLSITEKEELEKQYPVLAKYIKPFIGAKEFLHDNVNSYSRYCLWFKDGNVSDYVNIKEITERLEKVRALRKAVMQIGYRKWPIILTFSAKFGNRYQPILCFQDILHRIGGISRLVLCPLV